MSEEPRVKRFFLVRSSPFLCLLFSGDTILLTGDTFPPKGSADEVAVLEQ